MNIVLNTFSYDIGEYVAGSSCSHSSLKVYDVTNNDTGAGEIIKEVCGQGIQKELESTGNILNIEFRSGSTAGKTGFMIRYTIKGKWYSQR